ncbi:MAG: transcription elongation factor GreA [bacterium]|jgi:transcription elongation factor GreA
MAEDIVLTIGGKRKVEEELSHLKNVEMPALSDRIREARSLGDLSENFDYQDAKRQQGMVAGKIANLQAILDRAKIVEEAESGSDTVGMGSTVRLLDLDYGDEMEYKIVGVTEADPLNGTLSASSPVGSRLMGKKAGDKVSVDTPDGATNFEIIAVG